MDLTKDSFKGVILSTIGAHGRCRGIVISIRCKTWSAANLLPDMHGNPGQPWRDDNHLLGIPRNGSIPTTVLDSNKESENATEIALKVVKYGGFALAETPARRVGPKAWPRHVLPDCAKAVHMFDHPAWVLFASATNATELIWDQCMKAPEPALSPVKSSIWLCTPDILPYIKAEFGEPPHSLCNHPPKTHKALRGADSSGKYLTSTTRCENYSGLTNQSIARAIQQLIDPTLDGHEVAAVAGVVRGKVVPRHAVNHQFIHDSFNHDEARVLKHLHHALCDVPLWWADMIEELPCDACLRGDSKRLGPTGALPKDDGLLFVDIHHMTVPEIFTGMTVTVGVTHARSGHTKTLRVHGKGDAHEALEVCFAYYNSTGNPITWLHADNAWELKGTKAVALCHSKNIRITTTTVNSSRKNRQEPKWRVLMAVARKYVVQGNVTFNFTQWAWDHAEEGSNLRPSREPPFDCALGRLLSHGNNTVKPPGSFRRPCFCLCYPTIAPRLPSGTLRNKHAPQSQRALHLGFVGGRSGSFETIGTQHTQSGYACYLPDENRIMVTSDVSFVPGCFPGLARTSKGGWTIPSNNIPFLRASETTDSANEPLAAADGLREITGDNDLTTLDTGNTPP